MSTRVFVDLSPLAVDGSNGGAGSFVLRLLGRLASRLELHLLVKPETAESMARSISFEAVLHRLGTDLNEPRWPIRAFRRLPGARWLPAGRASLRRARAGVLFSPLQTASFHEPRLRHVAIAYDFQELHHPDFFPPAERRRRARFRSDLRRCDRVVAISRFTLEEAARYAGIARERLVSLPPVAAYRVPLSPARVDALLGARGVVPGSYAFYPANFWPHKNHRRLLEALARIPDLRLVLCGALEQGRRDAARRASALGIADRVSVLPFVPEDDLTALLQGARFLVFPSLFEGFGIPVLEAFALGTPVACSAIPALEEIAGPAALAFDPSDPEAIVAALSRMGDPDLRSRLAAAGRTRAAGYDPDGIVSSWEALLGSG